MSVSLDASDLRSGGRWSTLQRWKNFAIYLLLRFALALADCLPRRVLLTLGRAAGWLAHRWLARARRTAEHNLERALPDAEARSVAKECFVRAGENLATCLLLRRSRVRALDLIDVSDEALACIDTALAAGRGAVFVSAHLGPFEAIAAAVAELGRPASVVVRESYDPRLDPIVDFHRVNRGVRVIHRGAAGAAAKIVRALRRGDLVGFLPDLGGRVPSLQVQFLGRVFPFPVGPQRIACRAAVPLLIGILAPSSARPGRLRLEVRELSREGSESEMTQRVADALGAAIERSPGQWLWMAPSPADTQLAGLTPRAQNELSLPAFPPAA